MIITKFETWWVTRDKCLFDEKRQGGAKMGWDVFAIKLTADMFKTDKLFNICAYIICILLVVIYTAFF